MTIKDIVIPNNDNTIDESWLSINYLDTGNCTKNTISEIQRIRKGNYPLRAKRTVQKNDVIISTVRPNQYHLGVLKNIYEHMVVSTGFLVLRPKNNINPEYLYYYLLQEHIIRKLDMIANNSTSSYPSITPDDILNLEIDFPEKKEQDKIAATLSSLDTKIELNNKICIELEALAQDLYHYWFTQFDFPDEKGRPYRASGGKMVWNEELGREIPKGWEVLPLSDTLSSIIDHRGKTPTKLGGNWVKEGIIALSAKHVKSGRLIDLEKANRVSVEMYDKWMTEKLIEGDILMTSEAPLGEFYYMCGKTEYCLSQRLFAMRANKKRILPSYLYYGLSIGHGLSQILGKQSGSTVFGIRQNELRTISILIPRMDIQAKFDAIITPLLKGKASLAEESLELARLRDFLLPLLMNGQVKVGDA